MPITHLPFQLSCSQCEHMLIEAFISIEGGEIIADAIIVENADLQCPACQRQIKSSLDDLAKAMGAILEEGE